MRRAILSRAFRIGSSATAGLLVTGVLVGLSAAPAPAADGSVLHKSAQNVTHPNAGTASHGDVINWVVDYTDNGSATPAAATITDPISGATGAQTYVPGSLKVPPGWSPSWSADGTTFQGSDSGAATAAVRATTSSARQGGTNLSADLLPPLQSVSTATGGDGFTPVLYRADGKVEAWNLFHHSNAPAAVAVCTDLSTGQACSGGPWPKPINAAAGPLGSGNTSDLGTTTTEEFVRDPDRPGVVYYPAFAATTVGVACLDLGARANCGYWPLIDRGGSPSRVNNIGGLVEQGGNLYGVVSTGQVLCLSMASRTPCAGQPYAAVVPPNGDQTSTTRNEYFGSMVTVDGKVFISSSPTGSSTGAHPPAIGCFDPDTKASCAGWTTPHDVGPAGAYTYNVYAGYDTGGHADRVCATVTTPAMRSACFDFGGAAVAAPTEFDGLSSGAQAFSPNTVTTPDGHLRSYFGIWGGSITGAAVCHDWTAGGACAGFPLPATHPGVNGGQTRDYGYAYDTTSGCLFGLGDAGVLFSMDPGTATTPCLHSGADVKVTPSRFYCDGGSGHVQGYQNARLENIDVSHVDLAASTATVTDDDGTTIATPSFAPDGTIDLSGISVSAHPAIEVSTHLVLKNGGDFTGTNHPALVVTYRGDAPQVCFQTKVGDTCTVTGVSNTATGSDATGDLTSNRVDLAIAPGASCTPHVTVDKEICASTLGATCGHGGSGPWVKQTPGGLLGLLGTAYWRITVTNNGPVDAAKVTLNDHTESSCESAAGKFTLAVNQTKRFYCSTFLLVLPLKNTVTASFVPANSPPGTSPTTTDPSSAVACGVLCVLTK
ncbi:hypothetical protein Airi02_014390 [Actinoallomurus iriomotensis]|uniref:DUF7617 domain-containing protein n=1 Tax=Actinoallomurus iriomotensis TaxID=478107 RepID=A0A9W6RXA7_9ACTN|nr:hypothetical protein Airi02_014390 [Actinoallomurus iriomotensis]